MANWTVGVDIGQRRSPTAIAVAQVTKRSSAPAGPKAIHFVIRHLDRLPVGTPYPEVAERIAEVAERIRAGDDGSPTVYLDATGLGQPIVDLVAERWRHGRLIPVFFTHGDRRTDDWSQVTLGKAYLVARLQALLQTGRVHLPHSTEARILAEELLSYEIRLTEDANDRYGAFPVGSQDDLVTALGLAVQTDAQPAGGAGPLPW